MMYLVIRSVFLILLFVRCSSLLAAEADFLQGLKAMPGIKSTASGLQYIVVKDGFGKPPAQNDTVKIVFKSYLLADGQVFDSSYPGRPTELQLGGRLPRGLREGLLLMRPGGEIKLIVPPSIMFPSYELPGVPLGRIVIYEIELVSVKTDH